MRPRRLAAADGLLGRQPLGILFAAPYAVFLAAIFAYPLGLAVWMSFHDYFFAAPGAQVDRPFVGFENYQAVLADPDVRQAFVNVGIFLVINVPLTVGLSLVLASALDRAIRFRTFLRVAYYVPYVTASVALVACGCSCSARTAWSTRSSARWRRIRRGWSTARLAMPVIAIFVTWKQLGFFILLYLAALQNVSKDLYDAAAVDGASRFGQFRHVTVPGVRPATTLVVILATITGANLFTEPYLLTGGGGPDGASASPVFVMYQKGIEQGNPDTAAAIGVILVLLVLAISLVNRKLLERD